MPARLLPIGFLSYSREDDSDADGRLSQLRAMLAAELRSLFGRNAGVRLFQDVAMIAYGDQWEQKSRRNWQPDNYRGAPADGAARPANTCVYREEFGTTDEGNEHGCFGGVATAGPTPTPSVLFPVWSDRN